MTVQRLREIALGGNMYPDHVIFCGPKIGSAEKPSGEILIVDPEGRVFIKADANTGPKHSQAVLAMFCYAFQTISRSII